DDGPVLELGWGSTVAPLAFAFDDEVSVALGQLNAAAGRLVALTRRCILEQWWRHAGCASVEHWLTSRCGVERAHAARVPQLARELGDYPTVAGCLARGEITEDHAHAIVSSVDPRFEKDVATSATAWTVAQVRRFAGNYPKPRPEPEPDLRADDGPPAEA